MNALRLILTRRNRLLFPYLFKQTSKPTETISMDELEKERQSLEKKVHELVDKLEARKRDIEAKVPKEMIFRSKEEKEAGAAMEKLTIQENQTAVKQAEAATQQTAPSKKAESKGGKGRGEKEPPAPEKPIDVSRLDLRIGKILEVSNHPDADSLYVEKIDCGDPTGARTVISGLVKHVPVDQMKDRLVVVLCNLKPAKMRGILSEAMVMCASTEEKVEILPVPNNVKPGDRVVFDNYKGEPDAQLNPKKKIWEQVAPDLKTNADGVAMYKECEFRVVGVDGQFKSSLKGVQIR